MSSPLHRLPLRRLLLVLALALAGASVLLTPEAPPSNEGPVRRLLGPAAELAANVQWIRFDRARIAGRHELAIARAERALALDPTDTRGWDLLASHLGVDLTSVELQPDPDARLAWLRAALDVARRGEERADDPAALAWLQGFLLHVRADQDPELPWPGGVEGLWRDAAGHYARAAAAGRPEADLAALYALERADAARMGR